jgi:hypothetical protein
MDLLSEKENDIFFSKQIFYIYKGKTKILFILKISIASKNKNIKESKKFICPFKNCQRSYTLKNILLAHLRTHYGIKPFVCSYCSKSFNEKGNLKTHIRIHTGERPFKCKKCNKGFKALGQLKDHLISHTGFKPFQCPYCQKFYRRKEILKNHVIIHAKDPYFQTNQQKFKEMLDNVKNMKNIMHEFDSSDSFYKSNSLDSNFNYSISSNEESKQSLNSAKSTNGSNNLSISSNEEKKFNKSHIFSLKKVKNKRTEKKENKIYLIEKVNDKNKVLKENCPNLVSNLNDIISNTIDFSLKVDNNNHLLNFENNDFCFQKLPEMVEKEIDLTLKVKNNELTPDNCIEEQNINNISDKEDKEDDDSCSKMTNLYIQDYNDKKIVNYLMGF